MVRKVMKYLCKDVFGRLLILPFTFCIKTFLPLANKASGKSLSVKGRSEKNISQPEVDNKSCKHKQSREQKSFNHQTL